MSTIEIISASAGSGKTYRLAQVLDEAIASCVARPAAVLATTFTKKAAAELVERARRRLLEAGKVDDAQRLAAARIGTVNAVCGQLVGEFTFELGLAPGLRVLDEEAARVAMRQVLTRVLTDDDIERLTDIGRRFHYEWRWIDDVDRIVTLARANRIEPEALAECARRSRDGIGALFASPRDDADALDRTLTWELARFVEGVDTNVDTTAKTAEVLERARRDLGMVRRDLPLRWGEWVWITTIDVAKRSKALAHPLIAAAGAHDWHPRLHADLNETIERVFAIAARAMSAYAEYKRALGALDFTDQEVLALGLLDRPDVQERLRDEIDLVLVDEFQDTSPLQLAIFLKLAALAERSVWVGDQKQAIFGFRGTDPALMDAAVESILAGAEPETLGKSWRSRPELVHLTSALFGTAFARHGIPATRVSLVPEPNTEPEGLGPVVERWRLATKNKDGDAHALAAAVRELLSDPEARVRNRDSGTVRALRPADVAILCATNDTCAAVAAALAGQGIEAVLPRAGLIATAEGRLVLAGLRLFVDPRDSLAAAELARLVAFPADGDEWVVALLGRPADAEGSPFEELAIVRGLATARAERPLAGALPAFDAVLEAIGARERCLAWGASAQRLANLDALRAHAVVYTELCAAEGVGCTPAGLIAALLALGAAGVDEQAVVVQDAAVAVSTWHSAKGLEWPVTVLFELDRPLRASALGVSVASDRVGFDLQDPLAERWIRYWPQPYHPAQTKAPFHQRLQDDDAHGAARQAEERQALRLLYVGWTRARDRIVLACRKGRLNAGPLQLLADDTGPLVTEPAAETSWAGRPVAIRIRETEPAEPVVPVTVPGAGYDAAGPRVYPPATLPASQLAGIGLAGAPERVGERLPLNGAPDMQLLGEAIHGFLAADRPSFDRGEREEMARGLLERWGVVSAVDPAFLVRASDALQGWVERLFPGAVWHREWPIVIRREGGTVVRGNADLVLEHEGAYVIIDHKSFPGSVSDAVTRAATFGGQLRAYAEAVALATGKPVRGCFIHLPVSGVVVPVEAGHPMNGTCTGVP